MDFGKRFLEELMAALTSSRSEDLKKTYAPPKSANPKHPDNYKPPEGNQPTPGGPYDKVIAESGHGTGMVKPFSAFKVADDGLVTRFRSDAEKAQLEREDPEADLRYMNLYNERKRRMEDEEG